MYTPKNFDHLLGTPGFSDTLLKNHFTLYEGYVKNCNLIKERYIELSKIDQIGSLEFNMLKMRAGWEHNGMHLHELYFGNMKKGGAPLADALRTHIAQSYGTYETWEKVFRATGMIRGVGWVVLGKYNESNHLFTAWIDEHDKGHRPNSTYMLVMDVFEHAYITDYGIKRADYIEVFMKAIDWSVVEQRFAASQ